MPGPMQQAGATVEPSEYAPLAMDTQFTGIWTHRNPLRDAAVPYVYRKFYGASRFDSIIDGINREIGPRLTDVRRPGCPVFNSDTFPAANSYYAWKYIQDQAEVIRLILDGADGEVYDFTPTAVGGTGKISLYAKSAGAAKAAFCGVNTQLFYGDGKSTLKWTTGSKAWAASTDFSPGDLIAVGTPENGDLYLALGGISLPVIASASNGTTFTLWIDPVSVPLNFPNLQGASVSFSGLGAGAALNGNTYAATIVSTTLGVLQVTQTAGSYTATADTGTGTTGNGTSGGSAPAWNTARFSITADGGQQWKNYGPQKQNHGLTAPTAALKITAPAASVARFWLPNAAITGPYAILDSNGDVEVAAASGVTGLSYPTWTKQPSSTSFAVVSATQSAGLAASRPFYQTSNPDTTPPTSSFVFQNTSGVALLVSASADAGGGGFHGVVYCDSNALPTTEVAEFSRVNSGSSSPNFYPGSVTFLVPPGFYYGVSVTSGGASPSTPTTWTEWALNGASSGGGTTGSGSTGGPAVTLDGSVSWKNYGTPGSWQSSTSFDGPWDPVAPVGVILDSNGNWQYVSAGGASHSGSTEPAWSTTVGVTTADGGLTWTCLGPAALLTTASIQYGFSLHAIDGTVSTSAPVATIFGPIVGLPNNQFSSTQYLEMQGSFTADTQQDQVWIWRTAQGQSTLVLEDQIPVDAWAAGSFTYHELGVQDTSTNGNGALNALVAAPINKQADPPPAGFLPMCYHLGRMWGIVGNTVVYSAGPDAVVGNGNTQFPPLNFLAFQDLPVLCFSSTTTQGPTLMAWTTGGLQPIYGDGTGSLPFIPPSTYMAKTGILSRFAVDMVGSTLYAMTSNSKLVSFDPSAGYTEIGFPVGDQFTNVTTGAGSAATGALYSPANAYVTWYERNSGETGLFVADGAVGWFRFSPISPPESGGLWSPRAAVVGGTSAVQSIETAPGIFTLLIGPPSGTPGPILMRDTTGTVFGDGAAATGYPAWDVKGSIGLCDTGEVAEIAHIALKSKAAGKRPSVSLLLDEIAAGVTVEGQTSAWDLLEFAEHHEDPPNLDPSITVYSDRYTALQDGGGSGEAPQGPKCEHFQFKVDYGSQAVGDELLKFAVFGAVFKERRQQ